MGYTYWANGSPTGYWANGSPDGCDSGFCASFATRLSVVLTTKHIS